MYAFTSTPIYTVLRRRTPHHCALTAKQDVLLHINTTTHAQTHG